jgi:UrcA family protein
MYTKTVVVGARSLLGAGAIAWTLLAGNAVAKESVIIAVHVSTRGLDLSQPADARTFYTRLEHAAWVVCTHGNRFDLVPTDDPKACYETALGGAIRSAGVPSLTQIYVAKHSLQEAVARGVQVPAQIAAK